MAESNLICRIHTRMFYPPSKQHHFGRDSVCVDAVIRDKPVQRGTQLWSHDLVCIKMKHPRVPKAPMLKTKISLTGEIIKWTREDTGAMRFRDLNSTVATPGIENNNVVTPRERFKVRIPTMPPTHSDLIPPTVPI